MDFDFDQTQGIPFVKRPYARLIPTFAGSQYGTIDRDLVFTADFEVEVEFSTTGNTISLLGEVGSNDTLLYVNPDGTLQARFSDTVGINSTALVDDGKIHTAIMRRIGTDNYLIIDGVDEGTINQTLADAVFNLIGNNEFNLLYSGQILSVKFSDNRDKRTNVCLWNRDLNNAVWTKINAPVLTQNKIGVDGVANKAWTVEDNNGGAFEYLYEDAAIANDAGTHVVTVYVDQEDDETTFPEFQLLLFTGTSVYINLQLNKKTGATVTRSSSGTVTVTSVLVNEGGIDRWKLTLTAKNNTSGNVSLRFLVFPAVTTVIGIIEVSATGTVTIDAPQFELNQTETFGIIFTEGTPASLYIPIVTDYVFDSGSDFYQLPKNAGTLGVELVSNGTFDDNIDGFPDSSDADAFVVWNIGQYIDLVVPTTNVARFDFTIESIVGATYTLSFENISNTVSYHIGTTLGNNNIALAETDTELTFVALSTTTYFRFYNAIATSTISVDNIFVKELPHGKGLTLIFVDNFDANIDNWSNYGAEPTTKEWSSFGGGSIKFERISAAGYEGASLVGVFTLNKHYLITGRIYRPTGSVSLSYIGTQTSPTAHQITPSAFDVWENFSVFLEADNINLALFQLPAAIGATFYTDNVRIQELPDLACILTNFALSDWDRYTQQRNILHDSGVIAEAWIGDDLVTGNDSIFETGLGNWVPETTSLLTWNAGTKDMFINRNDNLSFNSHAELINVPGFVVGDRYIYSVNAKAILIGLSIGSTLTDTGVVTIPGVLSLVFVASVVSERLKIAARNNITATLTVDNITAKKLLEIA